jgi:hypothetical protein
MKELSAHRLIGIRSINELFSALSIALLSLRGSRMYCVTECAPVRYLSGLLIANSHQRRIRLTHDCHVAQE